MFKKRGRIFNKKKKREIFSFWFRVMSIVKQSRAQIALDIIVSSETEIYVN